MIKLDIRTKLFILLLANILMFKSLNTTLHLVVAVVFTLYLVLLTSIKRAKILATVYLIFTLYEVYFIHINTFKILDSFLLLSGLMFKTIYFPICAGVALVTSSKVSELICFLRKIKMPRNIIIVLAVLFRFFPVLMLDYRQIKNSLKMKGIGIDRGYYIVHPIKFLEYVFVPFVIISTNIANELSVSCLCRGIDNDDEPTSYITLKFTIYDYLTLLIMLAMTIYFLFWR